MYNSSAMPSLSDIAAVTNGDGFGGNNGWWILIILFAIFGGWGGYGGGYGAGGVQENYILSSDMGQLSRQIADTTAMTERKLDSVTNGLCTIGYDSLAQSNTINTNILTVGNTLQGAIKDCCCQTQQNIKDTQYAIATNANMLERSVADGFCQTNFNAQTNTRDIIDNHRNDTQAILAKLDAMENSRKDEKIAEQACIINNQYLLSQINKNPVPAYVVPNPYCNCGNQTYGYTGTVIA